MFEFVAEIAVFGVLKVIELNVFMLEAAKVVVPVM
jgi:hypothetical protein